MFYTLQEILVDLAKMENNFYTSAKGELAIRN